MKKSKRDPAELARRAVRRAGRARSWGTKAEKLEAHQLAERLARPIADPLHPWRQIPLSELTGGAASFAKLAEGMGHDVAARAAGAAVQVGVHRNNVTPDVGTIRATWLDGKTQGVIFGGALVGVTQARDWL